MIGALLRLPALHFALIGALLFVLTTDRSAPSARVPSRLPIVIDADTDTVAGASLIALTVNPADAATGMAPSVTS